MTRGRRAVRTMTVTKATDTDLVITDEKGQEQALVRIKDKK